MAVAGAFLSVRKSLSMKNARLARFYPDSISMVWDSACHEKAAALGQNMHDLAKTGKGLAPLQVWIGDSAARRRPCRGSANSGGKKYWIVLRRLQ
jgi:hypothetical protein